MTKVGEKRVWGVGVWVRVWRFTGLGLRTCWLRLRALRFEGLQLHGSKHEGLRTLSFIGIRVNGW